MAKKILVVDDDAINLKIIQSYLKGKGFEAIIARDGDVGLERAQKEMPDLILLDIEMPRMNGYFFIGELRKIELLKGTPVIVVTSHEDMENVFLSKGIKDYIVK